MMKTDVRETDTTYEVDVDYQVSSKEDINVNYENGYLTISTSKGLDKDEKDKDGRYIRQERYVGNMTRSFYLGDIPKEDIKAKYEGGVLRLSVPKSDMNKLKQIAFILVLALSLTTFAACGKNNKDMNNGTNNHSVTENGTDKNGANDNNIVDDNATTDSNGTVNDRSDTNGIDYGTTGEHMRDAAENAKDAVERHRRSHQERCNRRY